MAGKPSKSKKGTEAIEPVPGTLNGEPVPHNGRRVKEVRRNHHRHDREAVFDDGEQVLNDNLGETVDRPNTFLGYDGDGCPIFSESVTTGSIASFPGTPQNKERPTATSKGSNMTKKHEMPQKGKPISGRSVKKEQTGAHGTEMKDHGDPFGKKQKNTGGQFEKFEGGGITGAKMNEHLSPAEIANTITDDGQSLQELFNNYSRGVNYVSIREFNEIAAAYGCVCHNEKQFISLMESNHEFMFIEGADGGGRFWVPQLISENIANFGGKQGKPFGKGGKKDAPETDEGESEEGTDEGEKEEDDDKPKSKKPWEENRGRNQKPINEMGFQHEEPEDHFDRFSDPNALETGAFMPDEEDEFGGGEFGDEEFAGAGDGTDEIDHEGGGLRGGDMSHDEYGGAYGGEKCPECNGQLDELGCPECGFTADEFEQNRFDDPSEIAGNRDEFASVGGSHKYTGGDDDNLNDLHGHGDEFADEFEEGRGQGRQPLNEASKDGMTDMGKEWPRKQKNTGGSSEKFGNSTSGTPENSGMQDHGDPLGKKQKNTGGQWEEMGDSKHGEPNNSGMSTLGDPFGKKQKNTGGQFEKFEGGQHDGQLTGGAQKMHESVNILGVHVRKTLAEYARAGSIAAQKGRYPMKFLVSVGEHVKPKAHNQLTEALTDAEELVQVFGPEAVSFEAQFCRPDGSVAMKRLVPMIRVSQRSPIVQESAQGRRILFRFPEIARDYADIVVEEGRACRAVTHNWGAAVSARLSIAEAGKVFEAMKSDFRPKTRKA